jgi:hypothetical protein
MFSNLGSGLVNNMFGGGLSGQLANNVIMPGVNRMTGGGSLQNIGSRMFGGQQGQQTPQQQVDQSQQGGGILKLRGQGQQPTNPFQGSEPGLPYTPGGDLPYTPGIGQIGQLGGQPGMFEPDQEQNQQYFQQMHENMNGMNEALQQIEGMKMPGGQYRGGGFTPGGGGGGKFGTPFGGGVGYSFNQVDMIPNTMQQNF